MNTLRLLALLAVCPAIVFAKTRTDIPLAPMPAKVLAAKTVFLVNVCQDDLAYDSVYAAIRAWGRFQLVDSADAADLIVEVSTVNYATGVRIKNRPVPVEEIVLTILDGASKGPLWSTAERCRFAVRAKNREKETIDAAERLVGSLKARAPLR